MGIRIDPSLVNEVHDELGGTDEVMQKLLFALDSQPKMEVTSQSTLVECLKDIDVDMVLLNQWFGLNKSYVMELANLLKANNIPHRILKSKTGVGDIMDLNLKECTMPVKITMGSFNSHSEVKHIAKNVQLVNSNEINIGYK
jgi:hypothetical protein